MVETIQELFMSLRISSKISLYLGQWISFIAIIFLGIIIKAIIKKTFKNIVIDTIAKTKNQFDDVLLTTGITNYLLNLIPLTIVYFSLNIIFSSTQNLLFGLKRIILSIIVCI